MGRGVLGPLPTVFWSDSPAPTVFRAQKREEGVRQVAEAAGHRAAGQVEVRPGKVQLLTLGGVEKRGFDSG